MKYGDPGWGCAEAVKQRMYGSGSAQRTKTLLGLDKYRDACKKADDELLTAIKSHADEGTFNRLNKASLDAHAQEDANYAAYRALPEESDAWAVGDRLGDTMFPPK